MNNEETIFNAIAAIGFFTAVIAILAVWVFRRRKLIFLLIPLILIGIGVGSIGFWYTHRQLPSSIDDNLFQGVVYQRETLSAPRSLVIHLVRVDLTNPNIHFLVTPRNEYLGWDTRAITTSQFLADHQLQLAINGDFFDPWRDFGPFDYYPHVGDPVNMSGLSISDGQLVTNGYAPPDKYRTFFITSDNQVSFDGPPENVRNAISGNIMLIENGISTTFVEDSPYINDLHPRAVIGLNASGQTLLLLLVDGRQPNYSEGVSLPELVQMSQEFGMFNALNIDGGGSVTLVQQNQDGEPIVLNSPIHNRVPGRERPIANHLGIYAASNEGT